MRRFIHPLIALLAVGIMLPAQAALRLSVSSEAREALNTATFVDQYSGLAVYLSSVTGIDVKFSFNRDLSRELQHARSGTYEVIMGPAHVIGTAIRYGYEPVARFTGDEHIVFIATEASGVKTLEDARGKRLALPPGDSLATYLARGELNARGLNAKAFFGDVHEYRYHEAALVAMEFGQADLAVVDRKLADDWLKRNRGHILAESRGVPGVGVAVLRTVDKSTREKIRAALLTTDRKISGRQVASLDLPPMRPIDREEYAYVSTLGYFTPNSLDDVKRITADEAAALMKTGVPIFDTRIEDEYLERHIRGALNVPYQEKSAKEVGFDAAKDRFEIAKLPHDKAAPLIFACNGPECWKSYKASVVARRAGYKQIYWLRGGFPEWREKNLPTE